MTYEPSCPTAPPPISLTQEIQIFINHHTEIGTDEANEHAKRLQFWRGVYDGAGRLAAGALAIGSASYIIHAKKPSDILTGIGGAAIAAALYIGTNAYARHVLRQSKTALEEVRANASLEERM